MYQLTLFALLAVYSVSPTLAEDSYVHLEKDVKIEGYTGPFDRDMLTMFKNMETLELVNCNLTSVSDRLYSKISKLRKIIVNNTICGKLPEDVMQDAKALEENYCIKSSMEKFPLRSFRNLHSLQKLVVNELNYAHKTIPSDGLHGCETLKVFEFSANGLENIENSAFKDLGQLRVLNLAKNKMKTISKEVLEPLKKLKTLHLEGNQFEKFRSSDLPKLPNLEEINISNNPLNDFNLDNIDEVAPKLKTVVMIGTPIIESKLKEMSEKSKLQIIYAE